MLFSEGKVFSKKNRPTPPPIMDPTKASSTTRRPSVTTITTNPHAAPTRPARAYSNERRQATSPTTPTSSRSPSWMRKFSLPTSSTGSGSGSGSGSSSRHGSIASISSSSSTSPSFLSVRKLSLPVLRRKKSEQLTPAPRERQQSVWTHHTSGEPRTVFRNAGRDERGRLRLEYAELGNVEW